MLQRLFVQDVAIIERLDIELGNGFNVLTGETGAGKSIIIDAVNLILGERASKELIKHGADKAVVEAVFDISHCSAVQAGLDQAGIAHDDELLLSRELSSSGKNICRINGTLATLATLKQLTGTLVDVHGQHEHQSLIMPSTHLSFLDMFVRGELAAVKAEVASLYAEHKRIRMEQLSGFSSEDERAREIDMLSFQIKEITAAQLNGGEDERLLAERTLLINAERIMSAIEAAHSSITDDEGALSTVDAAKRSITGIAGFSDDYEALREKLEDAYYTLDDIGTVLRDYKNSFEFDPDRLNEIENRLELLSNLKRKYGVSISDVIEFCNNAQERLQMLQTAGERRAEIAARMDECTKKYATATKELTRLRHEAAKRLKDALLAQLCDLGLDKAKFDVYFDENSTIFSPNGVDKPEFMLSTNPGEPLKPLSKVASGGEMSRIMLAFKAIFANNDEIPTLIFDEIDTGISGRIAGVVGDKMVNIADSHQVICITHLPQIAALADQHFLVEKCDDGIKTTTGVRLLDKAERCRHLALMMDGNPDSDVAYNHARELIDACECEKIKRRAGRAQ
ncbi:MAG: DNA repair protein RecN [Clostridia bacterium]